MVSEQDQKSLTTIAVDWVRENVGSTWSTPRASDGEKGSPNQSFGAGGVPLPAQVVKWATPLADDTSNRTKRFAQGGTPLSMQASEATAKWCTPSVAISTGGQSSRSGDRQGEELLTGQARTAMSDLRARSAQPYIDRNIWPTPTALNRPRSDETLEKRLAYRKAKAGQTTVPLYLEEVATSLFHHLDLTTSTLGEPSSPSDPTLPPLSLNPLFVAWLMNWIVPASTNSGWAEMGSTLYAERMRFELSRLASAPAAPPAQADLFG